MAKATPQERVYLEVTDDMKLWRLNTVRVLGDDVYLEFEGDKLIISRQKRMGEYSRRTPWAQSTQEY